MNYSEYIIEKYCDENINLCENFDILEEFNTEKFYFPFEKYLQRIHKYCRCSNSCYYVAILYIDKFLENNKIKQTYLYKIFFIALLLAIKWLDDCYYTSAYYSTVSGIEINHMIDLEFLFFQKLNYNLYIDNKIYKKIEFEVNNYIEKNEKKEKKIEI